MNVIKKAVILCIAFFFAESFVVPGCASAYVLTTTEIYKQAHYKNYQFMNWITRYSRAIDVQNRSGDTAYCIALKNKDFDAQQVLKSYGANLNHPCVTKIEEAERKAEDFKTENKSVQYSEKEVGVKYMPSSGSNYLWWGLGALAVGGGAVAIASSNGGGSVHISQGSVEYTSGGNENGSKNNNTGDDDAEGENNTGGSDDGGEDNTGGGDDDGTETTGGSSSSEEENTKSLTDVSAAYFKTAEYTKGNYLDAIHAAEAYSIIYKKDENGNLVSHQAASDEPLKKVKVGVIDTGVYQHTDLGGKIVGAYDANTYNSKGNAWGVAKGNIHYYVLYENGKYYFFRVNTKSHPVSVSPYSDLNFDELASKLTSYGLVFSDFTLMNGAGQGTPGVSDKGFKAGMDNVVTWWNIVSDLHHGTHVAGIIAANKNDSGMHGVAFENAQIYAASWDYNQSMYPMVKTMVDNEVSVLNNSWGYTESNAANSSWLFLHDGRNVLSSYAYAASHGVVWVQATGNEGMTEAGVQAGIGKLNLSSYGYNGPGQYEVPFVAVTALDVSKATETAPVGRVADYANWCGSAKNYCIAAPGTDIYSTANIENSYVNMEGTSMAAPVVSGSIALLMGYYPYLTGQNIAWLLLETANNTGAYADSTIYGRGVLDLERALQPVGILSVASGETLSSLKPVNQSRLHLTGATQKQLAKAMPKDMVAFDVLKRPFKYDMANMVSKTHGSNANLRNEVSHMAMTGAKKVIKDEKTGFSFSSSEAMNKNGQANLSSMEIVKETGDGESTRFYYAEQSKYATSEDALKPSTNPYLSMRQAYGAENTMKLSESSKLKLSLQTGENGLYERDYEQDRQSFKERSYAINAEYNFNLTDYLELATVGGMLFEEDAMLGMNGEGGFAIRDGSTYYMGIKAALNITPNLSLLMAYYRGYTQGQDTSLMSISDLETESYMMAAEYRLNGRGDKVGLSLSSPLSVVKGKAGFKYASGRDNYSDTVYMQKLTTSLKPAAQEYDLGLYYMGKPKEDFGIMGKVETRFNADGEKGQNDYIGIIGISKSF